MKGEIIQAPGLEAARARAHQAIDDINKYSEIGGPKHRLVVQARRDLAAALDEIYGPLPADPRPYVRRVK